MTTSHKTTTCRRFSMITASERKGRGHRLMTCIRYSVSGKRIAVSAPMAQSQWAPEFMDKFGLEKTRKVSRRSPLSLGSLSKMTQCFDRDRVDRAGAMLAPGRFTVGYHNGMCRGQHTSAPVHLVHFVPFYFNCLFASPTLGVSPLRRIKNGG